MHARWAMLGAFGAILPEALSAFGGDNIPGAVWWQVRARSIGRWPASPGLFCATARLAAAPPRGRHRARVAARACSARAARIAALRRCSWWPNPG